MNNMPEDVGAGDNSTGKMDRRQFVAATGLGAVGACYAAAIAYPVYRYLVSPAEQARELAAVTQVTLPKTDLPEPGTAMMFRFGVTPAMLIHLPDGTVACYSAVCTHLGCTVQYQPEEGRIFCACHSGVYDPQTGKNIAGPPPRPLSAFQVEVNDEHIIITRA